jgi:hypothetical protein
MTQKNIIVNGLPIEYKGAFSFEEFYGTLRKKVESLGYKFHEKRFEQFNGESGKNLFIEVRPIKQKTFAYVNMKIRIEMKNVKDVTIDVDGVPTFLQEGEIDMLFDAWVFLHYNKRWQMHPVFWFVKSVVNKWIYQFPLEAEFSSEVAADTHQVHQHMKAFLNLYRYKVPQAKVEE